jgi:hypothetical protein
MRSISNHSPQAKALILHIRQHLKENNVILVFGRGRKVRADDGDMCLGFFKEPSEASQGCLRVATRRRKPSTVLAVLVHEYCHFVQWINGDKVYKDHSIDKIDYILFEKITEKSSIRLMKQWAIPLNYSAVRRRSSSYLNWLKKNDINKTDATEAF